MTELALRGFMLVVLLVYAVLLAALGYRTLQGWLVSVVKNRLPQPILERLRHLHILDRPHNPH